MENNHSAATLNHAFKTEILMLLHFLLEGTGCKDLAEAPEHAISLRHLAESHLRMAEGWIQSGQQSSSGQVDHIAGFKLVCWAAKTEAGIWQTHQKIKP